MIGPAGYAAWHGANLWRQSRGRSALKLEPVHLILIGLLIAAAGLGWQWYSRSIESSVATSSSSAQTAISATAHYGIAWNFDDTSRSDQYFLGLSKNPGSETRIGSFQARGVNITDDNISCSSANIRVDATGQQLPVFFVISGDQGRQERIAVDQANAIPPAAEFLVVSGPLGTLFSGQNGSVSATDVTVSQFLDKFGGFWFIIECDKGYVQTSFCPKGYPRFSNAIGSVTANS